MKETIRRLGPQKALEAWTGPEGAAVDFSFGDEMRNIEVKCTFDKDYVVISSLEQLDSSPFLVIESLREDADGCSLRGKVEELQKIIADQPTLTSLFSQKLNRVGYIEELEETGTGRRYQCDKQIWFDTALTNFPALRKSSVSKAIRKVSYCLGIPEISAFVCKSAF